MKKNIYYAAAAVLVSAGLLSALKFSMLTGNVPWFSSHLQIDGESYLQGMLSIARERDFLNLRDIYHSPGYQIYLGFLYKLAPDPERIFLIVKLLAWLMYALSVAMVYRLGAVCLGWRVGLMAAVFLALSAKFHAYGNLLQYETLLGFLILSHVFLLSRWHAHAAWKGLLIPVSAGLLVAAIVLVQLRYLLLVPAGCLCFYLRARAAQPWAGRRALVPVAAYVLAFLLIAGFWSFHHSIRGGEFVFVSKGSAFRFQAGNNPNAQGYAWPYPVIVEPSGLNFIRQRPGQFLRLVALRGMYFMDIKKDVWSIPIPLSGFFGGNRAAWFERIFCLASLLALLGGILAKGVFESCGTPPCARLCLLLTLAAGVAGPLLIFSSSRFSVPLLPVIFLFQAVFFDRLLFRDK